MDKRNDNSNDNSKENSIIDHYIDYEDMQIGQAYIMQLTSGAILSGGLISKYESLNNNGEIVRMYSFAVTNSQIIDIRVDEVDKIDLVESYNQNRSKNILEYLKEFQGKHKVKCFNEDGELLSNSTILGEVIIGKKVWDGLPEEEKKEFIKKIDLTVDNIIEVINVCVKYMKENARMHEDRLRILNEAVKLMERYKRVENLYPYIDKKYEAFFNDLHISELFNVI